MLSPAKVKEGECNSAPPSRSPVCHLILQRTQPPDSTRTTFRGTEPPLARSAGAAYPLLIRRPRWLKAVADGSCREASGNTSAGPGSPPASSRLPSTGRRHVPARRALQPNPRRLRRRIRRRVARWCLTFDRLRRHLCDVTGAPSVKHAPRPIGETRSAGVCQPHGAYHNSARRAGT